jgi:hypothetical protein
MVEFTETAMPEKSKCTRKGSPMTKSLPDRSGIAAVALPDRSPKTTNRSAMTNDPLAGRANPRTARGRRVRDLFRSLVAHLPERDPVAEAQALKIAELTALAEVARAKAAELVDQVAADKASIAAFAVMINAITRAEGTARRAMIDFKGSVAAKPKPTLLQQKLAQEGKLP